MKDNLLWGIRWGATFAALFSVLAVAGYVVAGMPGPVHGFSIADAILYNVCGGLAIGALLGVFRKQVATPIGAGLLGFVAGGMMAIGYMLLSGNHFPGFFRNALVAVTVAVFPGVPAGVIYRKIFKD